MRIFRHRRLLLIVCALAASACFGIATTPGRAQAPIAEPALYPTRQNLFDIPFQIPDAAPGQEPVEVQLHVSENRGGEWTQYAKVPPSDGRFAFRASHDGEFWFCVRTLNKAGKLLPDQPPSAELRVLVDTLPPTIKLTCESNAPGRIRAAYVVNDALLKAETVEIFCRGVDAGALWKPVQVAPPDDNRPRNDSETSGTAYFEIDASAKAPLYVRITAADGAGNVAAEERQIEMPGQQSLNPNALPAVTSNQALGAIAQNSAAPAAQVPFGPWRPSAMTSQPTTQPPREAIGPPPPADGTPGGAAPPNMARAFPGRTSPAYGAEAVPPPSSLASGGVEPIPTGRATTAPFAPASTPRDFTTLPSTETSTAAPTSKPAAKSETAETIGPGEEESLPIPTPNPKAANAPTTTGPDLAGPSFGNAGPYTTARPESEPAKSLSAPESDDVSPDGVQPRLVNSRKFELDYDIESVGTAGVAKVELFGTRDGGKSWSSLGNDPDSTSPFIVNVDGEGTYGFRMVIESTTGLRGPAPQSGDLPEVWVGVDVTKPEARLVSAVPGTGEQAGELDIRWEAKDEHLTNRPIALAYSENAAGPWNVIASGLPNQGHYAWRMDSRIPAQLYLKLEARDQAGNTAAFITPEPVAIERVRPQGRIRGVRPIGEQARLRTPGAVTPR